MSHDQSSKSLNRRDFVRTASASVASGALAGLSVRPGGVHAAVSDERPQTPAPTVAHNGPVIVTSWEFGPGANDVGWRLLADGGVAIDAVEAAINHVELLPDEFYVGFGGSPNTVGETTLDAMMMWGPTHDVGAVGCLKRVKRAISVARKVMSETQHTLIVGDDATAFAQQMGFEQTSLTNAASLKVWEEWKAKAEASSAWKAEPIDKYAAVEGHDTVGTMAIDQAGNICVGCSTNGRTFKLPGRVGDSPIAGAGAYCDNDVGAAIATGNGDVMMRFLPTYHTVELMREGHTPDEAARLALKRIHKKGYVFDGGIIALRRDGAHGAAKSGWAEERFRYAARNGEGTAHIDIEGV
ncbi:MAG: N(4)-(beta-N-acetylglucosaminyl)-L-asparaginase [Pseudomonadota bacterium]